jgi:hypothetical protein
VENQQMAEDLNAFYCRFEKPRPKPLTSSDLHFTHTPPATPLLLFNLHLRSVWRT